MNNMVLNILDNEVLHLVTETAAIVIGSMLMGIFLAYLYWGSYRKRNAQLNSKLDLERDLVTDLRNQLKDITLVRDHLATEVDGEKMKHISQSRTIYHQNQQLYELESKLKEKEQAIEQLNQTIKAYEERLRAIESQMVTPSDDNAPLKKIKGLPAVRANYEHVSKLLGRQVIDNDLTIITGIGPRTASLLQKSGINDWESLAATPVEELKRLLFDAGGIYRTLDPTHWPKQASMAVQSEWRKLRVYQETLKKTE